MILFCIVIYCPLAHMTWAEDGLFANMGDILNLNGFENIFLVAGGTVVHMAQD